MTVNYEQYNKEKMAFIKKHNGDFKVDTSALDEYDCYYKTYVFEDGAVWYEKIGPEYVQAKVEIKLALVNVEVKMMKTEFWSTESGSKYYYEQY